jgi:energy-converting hydrogenase B subunit D
MIVLQALAFLLVAAGGTAVALTRDPTRQVLLLALYGLLLTVLFVLLQAPDVALSELAVGSAALPLILLVALAKVRGREHE